MGEESRLLVELVRVALLERLRHLRVDLLTPRGEL